MQQFTSTSDCCPSYLFHPKDSRKKWILFGMFIIITSWVHTDVNYTTPQFLIAFERNLKTLHAIKWKKTTNTALERDIFHSPHSLYNVYALWYRLTMAWEFVIWHNFYSSTDRVVYLCWFLSFFHSLLLLKCNLKSTCVA